MPEMTLSGSPGRGEPSQPSPDELLDAALSEPAGLADGEIFAAALQQPPPASPPPQPGIFDRITGRTIQPDDIDGLIDGLARVNQLMDELSACKTQIRLAVRDLVAGGTGKTRRIQGHRRKASVEMPDDGWDQSILKEVWNSYPELRDQVLKIGTIDVKLREFKKLASTAAATPDVETFKTMVEAARREPTALPAVKIEV